MAYSLQQIGKDVFITPFIPLKSLSPCVLTINGGILLRDLKMPDFRDYAEDMPEIRNWKWSSGSIATVPILSETELENAGSR